MQPLPVPAPYRFGNEGTRITTYHELVWMVWSDKQHLCACMCVLMFVFFGLCVYLLGVNVKCVY